MALITDNLKITENEIKCYHSLNRNFQSLLSNDLDLYGLYKEVYSSIGISDYQKGKVYNVGDLVWFSDTLKHRLYLLKCIRDNNSTSIVAIGNDEYQISQNFLVQGWKNQNDKLNILNLGVIDVLSSKISEELERHQNDELYHPLGKISTDPLSEYYIGKKLLKRDLSNVDKNRESNQYPSNTTKVKENGSVMNGYYRKYDNGILEYDIIFKFGEDSDQSNSSFTSFQQLSANTQKMQIYSGIGGIDSYDIKKYYYNTKNMDIFQYYNPSEINSSKIGLMKQLNRNDYVNVYSAKINFPVNFVNTNYMIYSNNILCQSDSGNVVPSQNQIVYTNKSRSSVVALYVTYPNSENYNTQGANTKNGGLISNSFHCKIIGIGD